MIKLIESMARFVLIVRQEKTTKQAEWITKTADQNTRVQFMYISMLENVLNLIE